MCIVIILTYDNDMWLRSMTRVIMIMIMIM